MPRNYYDDRFESIQKAISSDRRRVNQNRSRNCSKTDEEKSAAEQPAKEKKLPKVYVRYKEGAELYSMGLNTFRKLAIEAKAVYKVNKIALVNTKIFEEYLETFRVY